MSEPGWLSPALLQDAAMLHGADVSVDPFLACILGRVPPALVAAAQRWARHATEAHWAKEAGIPPAQRHVAPPTPTGTEQTPTDAPEPGRQPENQAERQQALEIVKACVAARLEGVAGAALADLVQPTFEEVLLR